MLFHNNHQATPVPWHDKRDAAWLALVLMVATAYRFYGLDQTGLWGAELVNAGYVSGTGLVEMLRGLALRDLEPPGYLSLLYVVAQCLGGSEFALRLLSAVAGVGAVCMVVLLGRRCQVPAVGLLAGLWLAGSPAAVMVSQEVQPPAVFSCLLLLQLYLFVDLLDTTVHGTTVEHHRIREGHWPLLTSTPRLFWPVTVLLLLVSYAGVLVVLLEGVLCGYWCVWRRQWQVAAAFRPALLPSVIVLVLWGPSLFMQWQKLLPLPASQTLPTDQFHALLDTVLGRVVWWQHGLGVGLLLCLWLLCWRGVRAPRVPGTGALLQVWWLVTGLIVLLVAAKTVLPWIRLDNWLVAAVQPLLLLLAATGVVLVWQRWLVPSATAVLTVAVLLASFGLQLHANVVGGLFRADRKPDLRPVIEKLLADTAFMRGFRTVFVSADPVEYYLRRYHIRPDISDKLQLKSAKPDTAVGVTQYLNQTVFYYIGVIETSAWQDASPLLQALTARYGVLCYSTTAAARLVKFDTQTAPTGIAAAPPCADRVDILPSYPTVVEP